MTDEMIQQIPQQRGSYAVPGLITGAAVGGLGGAAASHYKNWGITQKPDLEKVFAQAPDYFEAQGKKGDKAKWSDAGKIVKGVQDLEKEYDEKIAELQKTGGITDKDLTKDLVNRRNSAQSNLDRVLEAEKNRLGSTETITEFPSREVLKKELNTEEFKVFEPYLKDYEAKKAAVLGKAGAKFSGGTAEPAYKAIGKAKNDAGKIYDDFFAKYDKLSDTNKEKFNAGSRSNAKIIKAEVDAVLPESFNQRLRKSAPRYSYADFQEFQRRFGEDMFEIVDKKPTDTAGRTCFEVKNGTKKAWVMVDTDLVKAEREALKNSYIENINQAMDIKSKIKNFNTEFFDANKDALKVDFEGKIKDAAELEKLCKNPKDIKVLKDGVKSIELVEESIKKGMEKFPVKIGTETFNNAEELSIGKAKVQTTLDWVVKYTKELQSLNNELNAIVRQDPRVTSAYAKFKSVIANDEGVKDAIKAIEKLNGKYSTEEQKALYEKIQSLIGTEVSSLSDEEILSKAKESKAYQSAEEKLKAVQDEIAKYAEEKGLKAEITQEEAIKKFGKSKQEFVKASKDKAKSELETLLKDLKVGNKWANAAIAGGILALAGLGIGASMSKDA